MYSHFVFNYLKNKEGERERWKVDEVLGGGGEQFQGWDIIIGVPHGGK
jgi:hypothetical protein